MILRPYLLTDVNCVAVLQVLALRILAGVCLFALNRFPSTLAEDEMAIDAALQGREPLAADVLLAVQFRAEKKRVLYDTLASIAGRIKACRQILLANQCFL